MHRPEFHSYFAPDNLMELTSIAGDDLMKGVWQHGVNDPRTALNELRRWFWDRHNSESHTGNEEELYHNGADLIQKAIGAAMIGDLRSDSATLRYIFAIIEQRSMEKEKSKDRENLPGPYFIQAMQILLLAAKPTQREDLMNAIFEATGMPQFLSLIVR